MPDKVSEAYSVIKGNQLFLDEADFREQLTKSPKDVFNVLSKDKSAGQLFLDYDDFETSLGLKKKDVPYPSRVPDTSAKLPSSGGFSPLEIPRPQGQSEKVRVEAGAVSDKQVDPTKLGSFLPQDRTSAPKTDLAATLTQARQTAKLMEEKPLIKERQQVVKREAFDNTLKAYSKGKKLSQAQLDTKAKELDKMLSEGKLQIAKDPTTGKRILAYKDENFFTSFFDSAKRVEANRLLNKRISDASLPEKIKIVEEENQKESEYLPELPSGAFGSLGEWGAGLTTPLLRPVGYGLAAVGAASMLNAPAAYTAAANTVGSTIAFVEDMMYSGRAETFRRVYNGLMADKPNATEQEKMEAAKQADEASLKSAAVGAGEAILFGVPFSRFAKLEQSALGYKSKLEGIAKHTLEESPKAAFIMGSGATGRAAIAKEAGAQDVDIIGEGLEAAKGGVEMVAGFGILKTIPHAMGVLARTIVPPSKSITSQAKAIVSELPREEVIRIYEEGEKQGVFEEGTAKRVSEELKSYDEAKAAVPETVQKSETQDALAGKLEAKFKKEKELAETKIESRKREIEEEIAQIDKDIDAIYEGKPIEEHEYDVTGKKLSELKPVEFEEQITTEEQFKEPIVETVEQESQVIPLQEQQKSQDITLQKEDWSKKSDADIENRMAELEGKKDGAKEFNLLEKEMEKRERDSVFNVPLEKVSDSIDSLIKKEKEKPNGFGSFIEKSDARETKEVAKKYLNPKSISDSELKQDFKDAVMGNPSTWYADGLKLRESMKEAASRGIDTRQMVLEIEREFEKNGYTKEEAQYAVAKRLEPIFKDATQQPEQLLGKPKETINDKENITGVSGKVGEGKEPIQAQPIKETSGEKISPSGDVQSNAKEEVAAKSIKDKFKDIADINLSDNPEVVKKREVTKYLKDNPEIADVVKNFRKVTDYLEAQGELKKSSPNC